MASPGTSVFDSSLEDFNTVVGTAQQLRWIRLSALVVVLWDHSKCSSSYSGWVNVHRPLNHFHQSHVLTKRYDLLVPLRVMCVLICTYSQVEFVWVRCQTPSAAPVVHTYPTSETSMDPLFHSLYDSKYNSKAAPIFLYSNEPQIRYSQAVALTFYVWGRPRVHFRS